MSKTEAGYAFGTVTGLASLWLFAYGVHLYMPKEWAWYCLPLLFTLIGGGLLVWFLMMVAAEWLYDYFSENGNGLK